MAPDPTSLLTEGQKACLRLLWHERLKIAEIAFRLKISPDTVDQRLRRARTLLGTTSSVEAARLLAESEGTSPSSAYPASGVPAEAAAPQAPVRRGGDGGFWRLPLPRHRGEANDLSVRQRLFWALTLTILAMVTMFLAMSMGEVLTRLFLLWK